MSWMGAYGFGALGGVGSAAQSNPNSFNPYMGGQQSSSYEEAVRKYMSMQAQRCAQPQPASEAPKKPKSKFGSTIKALKDELQEETDKWLAGVLDA